MKRIDPLFKGATRATIRSALDFILKSIKFDTGRCAIPFSGTFAVPETLVGIGIKPENIATCDITLFSSSIGYLVDPAKKISDLQFEIVDPDLLQLTKDFPSETEADKFATIMYAVRYGQFNDKNESKVWLKKEFVLQKNMIFEKFKATGEALQKKLGGIKYEIRDAFSLVDEYLPDSKAMVFLNPPGYKGGYTKQFSSDKYTWAQKEIPEIDPATIPDRLKGLYDHNALVLLMLSDWCNMPEDLDQRWEAVYAEAIKKTDGKTYIFSNKAYDKSLVKRSKHLTNPSKIYPVYDESEITKDSVAQVVKTDRETALYYYDLFVRELGFTDSEQFSLFVIDGRVAGTIGWHLRDWIVKREKYVFETFGLSITSPRYARIGRLLMATITCREFIDQLEKQVRTPGLSLHPRIEGIKTTCLTKYAEAKKNRGILKLIKREKLKNGRFKLLYETAVHEKTIKEVLHEWIEKHAHHTRD